ncbi:Hint domain-containing protein [Celeribacter halophilus]|uniref:Hint domain-containing protein n=1 Tax=Celeribacter halophilus TaxID=576117 RepID=UPI003A8EB328
MQGAGHVERNIPDGGITYVHILFERHEVILVEGAFVESLMLTDYVNVMSSGRKQGDQTHAGPARLLVDGKKAKQLVARILKNHRPLYEATLQYGCGGIQNSDRN